LQPVTRCHGTNVRVSNQVLTRHQVVTGSKRMRFEISIMGRDVAGRAVVPFLFFFPGVLTDAKDADPMASAPGLPGLVTRWSLARL
jgi:hypothetical protein